MKLLDTGLALACAVGLSACASTDYGTRVAGERPTDLSSSEASFWYQMDQFEERLRTSGATLKDPDLQAFVENATCAITPDYCADLRIYIVRDPSFNASMAPNGMMLVHTGLLLRADNESELAAVLAHEFVHFEENHTLERYGAMKNTNRGMAFVGSLGVVGLLGMFAVADGASGFMQNQETQADLKGLKYMVAGGYNAASAERIWSNLSSEYAASSDKKKQKRALRGQFLSTHPGIGDRMAALRMHATDYADVETDPSAYRSLIRPFLMDWLGDEVAKSDPGSTLHLLDRMAELEQDLGLIEYSRGRVFALRGEDGDEDLALAAWTSAIDHPDAPSEAHRDLGEMYRDRGQLEAAADAYRTYLEGAPDARDAALIQRQLERTERPNS